MNSSQQLPLPHRQVINTLSQTTDTLELQSTITSILDSLVTDIEIAHSVEQKINHELQVKFLERRCKVAEEALREYKMLEEERKKDAAKVGELFLKDLLKLEDDVTVNATVAVNDNDTNTDNDFDQSVTIVAQTENPPASENANVIDDENRSGGTASASDKDTHIGEREAVLLSVGDTESEARGDAQTNANIQQVTDTEIDTHKEKEKEIVTETEGDYTYTKPQNRGGIHEDQNEHEIGNGEAGHSSTDADLGSFPSARSSVLTVDTDTPPEPQLQPQSPQPEHASPSLSSPAPIPSSSLSPLPNLNLDPDPDANADTEHAATPIRNNNKTNRIIQKKVKPVTVPVTSFHHLNAKTLMDIFAFMDALDIVNMAQTNVRLYKKVNAIFGLGGTVVLSPRGNDTEIKSAIGDDDDEDEDDEAILIVDEVQAMSSNAPAVTMIEHEDEIESQAQAPSQETNMNANVNININNFADTNSNLEGSVSTLASGTGTVEESVVDRSKSIFAAAPAPASGMKSSDSSSTLNSEHRATIVSIPTKATTVKLPPPKPRGASTMNTNANANANATTDREIATQQQQVPSAQQIQSNTSTQKQKQMPTTVQAPPPAAAIPKSPPPVTVATGGTFTKDARSISSPRRSAPGFQMSPAVAQSLASKLQPAELSAIISMRDQLRKKEEELYKADEDVNDLTAQLEGTMTVKETLTEKVKELKKALDSDREVSLKITRQTASDQEVIAFLDERVQELELSVDRFDKERAKANKSIQKVQDASERQVAVLNDMLAYEKDQKLDQEKAWKSTKKVLVKEVKHCRAQIMALEAERDGIREENDKLKEALMSLGAGNGIPSRNANTSCTNGNGSVNESRSRSFDTVLS